MSSPVPSSLPERNVKQSSPAMANLLCFLAMFCWAIGFPAGEVLLESWGTLTLVLMRMTLSSLMLMTIWIYLEDWESVKNCQWRIPLKVGAIGFGIGSVLFLFGQRYSDAVIPAIMAAMMPIFGGLLEVLFEGRRMKPRLIIGILFALVGGYLATGVNLSEGTFGFGALLCLCAIPLYAWSTRTITREFTDMSPIAQTTTTIVGAWVFVCIAYPLFLMLGIEGTAVGIVDGNNMLMLFIFSIVAMAISQALWIKAAGSLGILFASLHMNAIPFYVMIVMVIVFDSTWSWMQALGALLVGIGVVYSQMGRRREKIKF